MAVDTNNRTTVTVGGVEYEIEASNGAVEIYAKEFRDTAEKPFTGNLITDMMADSVMLSNSGSTLIMWCDIPHVEGALWAMAKAAGSTKDSFAKWHKRLNSAPIDPMETTEAIHIIFGDFGDRTFFRFLSRSGDAGVPDNESEKEEELHVI